MGLTVVDGDETVSHLFNRFEVAEKRATRQLKRAAGRLDPGYATARPRLEIHVEDGRVSHVRLTVHAGPVEGDESVWKGWADALNLDVGPDGASTLPLGEGSDRAYAPAGQEGSPDDLGEDGS